MAMLDSYPILGFAKAVKTDTLNTDAAIIDIPINEKGYVIRHVTVYNSSGSNNITTIGVFGNAAGANPVIVSNAATTGLTGPTVVQELSIAATALTPAVTADRIFVRVGTASGVPGSTLDVDVVRPPVAFFAGAVPLN